MAKAHSMPWSVSKVNAINIYGLSMVQASVVLPLCNIRLAKMAPTQYALNFWILATIVILPIAGLLIFLVLEEPATGNREMPVMVLRIPALLTPTKFSLMSISITVVNRVLSMHGPLITHL